MIFLRVTITAYRILKKVISREYLNISRKTYNSLRSIITVHYRLLGSVSVDVISAAEQAVRLLKLDREPP